MGSEQDSLAELYSEISPQFEARTLQLMADYEEENLRILPKTYSTSIKTETALANPLDLPFVTAKNYNLVISLSKEEIQGIVEAYVKDPYFSKILTELRQESNWVTPKQPLFFENDEGLLYFEDWNGNYRLYIPKSEQAKLLSEVHDEITEGAHSGYHRTSNKLACTYYWPRMSRDVKNL